VYFLFLLGYIICYQLAMMMYVYSDNTTTIVVSAVIGAVALIALVVLFQFIR